MDNDIDPPLRNLRLHLKTHYVTKLMNLKQSVLRYISPLPVIGFNSGKYDIHLIRHYLMLALFEISDENVSCIKRNNADLMSSSPNVKFLDVSSYLAPGYSYRQFLKTYGCNIEKGYFPYEWL